MIVLLCMIQRMIKNVFLEIVITSVLLVFKFTMFFFVVVVVYTYITLYFFSLGYQTVGNGRHVGATRTRTRYGTRTYTWYR